MKLLNTIIHRKYIAIIMSICWVLNWCITDSFYCIYVLLGTISLIKVIFSSYMPVQPCISRKDKKILFVVSVFFSILVLCANLNLFDSFSDIVFYNNKFKYVTMIVMGIAGTYVAWNNLLFIFSFIWNFSWNQQQYEGLKIKPCKIFLISTLLITTFNLIYLVVVAYPGNLSPDSINQIGQIFTGEYRNHHPFWHTMLIKVWIELGLVIFSDINAAVALYSAFQIIAMAMSFSYIIVTLYQIQIPKKYITICFLWILLMPYNVDYSVTMWKDILFAGSVSVFTVAFFRIIRNIGNYSFLNYMIFIISGIGFGLLRSNGWIALLITFCVLVIFLWKKNKKLIPMFMSVLLLTYLIKQPLLEQLGVPQPDFIESLSIPAQQIARVISEDCFLTSEQVDLLSQIVDIDTVAKVYAPYISDPIKAEVRHFGNQDYLVEHKKEFLSLWIAIGIKYPSKYFEAWIEQTKGYWNGGYPYWIFQKDITKNSYGIERGDWNWNKRETICTYLDAFSEIPLLQFFVSIGFHFWIVLLLALYTIMKKKMEFVLTLPTIAVIGTLLIATPVFSEFRYAYCIFTTIPILIFASFYKADE